MAEKTLSPTEIRRVTSGHIPALDGLRGVAILFVMTLHFAWVPMQLHGILGALVALTYGGWTGVDLFFVLSGFLITGILVDSKSAENYLSSFYIRRALRILPLYYGCLFVGFVLLPLLGKLGVPHLARGFTRVQIWYWFYLGNWAWYRNGAIRYFEHFWTLAIEEQFYFVWPWVVLMTSRRNLVRACILLVLVGPVARAILHLHFTEMDPDIIYGMTWCHLDTLGLGSLAALIVRDEYWSKLITPHLNKIGYSGLLIFMIIGLINRNFGNGVTFIYGVLPISIFFAGILLRIVATTGSNSILQRVLQMQWLRSYGKYSYAIYVFHGLLFYPYNGVFLPSLVARFRNNGVKAWFYQRSALSLAVMGTLFIVNIVGMSLLMLGAGKFSWWAFEGRINNFKSKFKVRWQT